MKSISEIDVNFKTGEKFSHEGLNFYNVTDSPFSLHGIFKENGKFRRIPEKIASSVSEGVHFLHTNTAGGRVRFKTDSSSVAIIAVMENPGKMSHFAFSGSMGFDLYVDNSYTKTFIPPCDMTRGYENIYRFETKAMREILINFPLYSDVCDLYIGIDSNAALIAPSSYKNTVPVVYYGSSITQGGCASRPGSTYESIISRKYDCDYINLGFSGNAKGEAAVADYIKNLDMSLFVYDYDHNAPTPQHLKNTHEKMFAATRKENPLLPIIIMSRPKFKLTVEEKERLAIIKSTYDNAVLSGDKNVYFLDGEALTLLCKNEGTVDSTHPNDFGFASMAEALCQLIDKINIF